MRYDLIAAVVAGALAITGVFYAGRHSANLEWEARVAKREKEAKEVTDGLTKLLEKSNAKYSEETREANTRLEYALRRLSERPNRLPSPARAACAGATGAELSAEDGGFLVREAARANSYALALTQCREAYDTAKRKIDDFNRSNK